MSVEIVQISTDPCIYVKDGNCTIVVAGYMDDLIIAT